MQVEADCQECGVGCWIPEGDSHLRCICTDCFDEAEDRRYRAERQAKAHVERLQSRSEDRTILVAVALAGLSVLFASHSWGAAIVAAVVAALAMCITAHWWS